MIETLVEEEFLDKEGYGKRATYELNPVASYPNQHQNDNSNKLRFSKNDYINFTKVYI